MQTRVHISLEVCNLDRSLAFYSNLFQREPSKFRPGYANFRMDDPQLHLALVERPGRKEETGSGSGNNRHYGIELFADDKLEGWLRAAQTRGLTVRVEEQVACCYAVANKFWARDPDGHEWEFWVRHGESDLMHEEDKSADASACCAPKEETVAQAPAKAAPCCAPGKC